MTRETKVGLLVGTGVILLIGVIVSDHLSAVQRQEPASLTQFAYQAGRSVVDAQDVAEQSPMGRRVPEAGDPTVAAARPTLPVPVDSPGAMAYATPGRRDAVSRRIEIAPGVTVPDMPRLNQTLIETHQFGVPETSHASSAVAAAEHAYPSTTNTNPQRPAAPEGSVHYVKQGESLWSIAHEYYGDGGHWRWIADANPKAIAGNGQVRAGVRLVVPQPTSGPAEEQGKVTEAQPRGDHADPADQNQTVLVTKGDSLGTLAEKHLGSESRWTQLYEANRDQLANPDMIRVGMRLRLPAGEPAAVTVPSRAQPAKTSAEAKTYVVESSDTLSSIAKQFLGDRDLWPVIFEANRDQLADANDLRPGQRINIPVD